MSLIEKLKEAKPGQNVVFTAVETLKDPKEIKQFYSEYIDCLKKCGDSEEVRTNPEAVANRSIGYILGYYDKETVDRWMNILPGVSHPIFGRDIFSVSPEDAYQSGRIAGSQGREAARCYIEQKRQK